MPNKSTFALLAVLWACIGCNPRQAQTPAAEATPALPVAQTFATSPDFGSYWYQGKAEVTSYVLEQARYGEMRKGEAVLIFVTEDFSMKKQVKLDDPEKAGADRVPVLKLNLTKKFNTGIYPYSLMQSVFTPVQRGQYPQTLKTTMTVQEWCGHVYNQLNLTGKSYKLTGYSYFESEGDESETLEGVFLEDEIWTVLRLDPAALPTGKVKMIPGSLYSRLKHKDIVPTEVEATRSEENGLAVYSVTYPAAGRSLTIRYQKEFPYQIESWEETYPDGWAPDSPKLTTRATLNKRIKLDYWTHNHNTDAPLRAELGLQ
ncbi:MAG: hypothetical protein EAZ89_06545 [Bacteroidetes bacterium]|nr:MAG: hypothetical protein EAZ89_06545 [Bacteroidota bacterium]